MARGEDKSGGSKGRVKFRFIEFEMDGSDQTLQNAIREITQAVGRPHVVVKSVTPALTSSKGNGASSDVVAASEVTDAELVAEEAQEQDRADEGHEGGDRSPKTPRRFKSPKIVAVDLRDGEMPLKTFFANAPDSDQKRYTLIAYWFKTYRNIPEVTPDHIYTAYREMGWTTLPKDAGAPLRALAKSGLFEKGEGELAYALNHIGEGKAQDIINKAKPVA